jgi:hypothetical protein
VRGFAAQGPAGGASARTCGAQSRATSAPGVYFEVDWTWCG